MDYNVFVFLIIFYSIRLLMIMILKNLMVGYFGYNIAPAITGYIRRGTMLAVMGPNGIGKSTLLKTFARLLPPISGKLEFKNEKEISIGYLPQYHGIDVHFPLTVFDVVSMGCWPKVCLLKKLNQYQQSLVVNALEKTRLLHVKDKYIGNLSGGQFQCMLIARILVQRASLILLDEPFQNIEYNICKVIIHSICQLCINGSTVVVILHDEKLIKKYFRYILSLTHSNCTWTSLLSH